MNPTQKLINKIELDIHYLEMKDRLDRVDKARLELYYEEVRELKKKLCKNCNAELDINLEQEDTGYCTSCSEGGD